MSKKAVIKTAAMSNISYGIEEPLDMTEDEWNELSREEQDELMNAVVWEDIDVWVEFVEEER